MKKEEDKMLFEMSDTWKIKLSQAVAGQYDNICGLVIIKAGHVIYRENFHGYDMCAPIHAASLTKSILSALTGIAIDRGYIHSVKDKIMSFFPDYQFKDENRVREEAVIEDLLNMTVPYSFEDFREPLEDFSKSGNWVRFALEMIDKNGRIGDFKYSAEGAHLLSAILTRATGKSTCEFANQVLFGPIGMSLIEPRILAPDEMSFDTLFGKEMKGWANDPQGITTGGWGLTMTPDDMARFGLLYLEQGAWNGEQIIPAPWVSASGTNNRYHYAYMWWQLDFGHTPAFAAMGDGGNMICCIPQKDLVVSIASAFVPEPKDRCVLIEEYILPYV